MLHNERREIVHKMIADTKAQGIPTFPHSDSCLPTERAKFMLELIKVNTLLEIEGSLDRISARDSV